MLAGVLKACYGRQGLGFELKTYMNSEVSGRSGSSSLTFPCTAKKASHRSGV